MLPGDLLNAFKGRTYWALMLGTANFLFFAVGLIGLTATFLDMYVPGYKFEPMQLTMAMHCGEMIFFTCAAMLCAASVGDEDVSYRLLRGACLHQMLNLGALGRDGIIFSQAKWSMDMRIPTVVQCYGIAFFMVHSMVNINFKLDAAPEAPVSKAVVETVKASPRGRSPGRAKVSSPGRSKTPTRRSGRSKTPSRR